MKLDIVLAHDLNYVGISPKHKGHHSLNGEQLPFIAQVSEQRMPPYFALLKLMRLVQNYPRFVIKDFVAEDDDGNKVNYEMNRLGGLITPAQVDELFDMHASRHKLLEQYEGESRIFHKRKKDFKQGRTKTNPEMNPPSSLLKKSEKMLDEKRQLNNLAYAIHQQIIRQHISNPFTYKKKNGLPCRICLENMLLKVAKKDGVSNNGHGKFAYEVYLVEDIDVLHSNQKDRLFPIRRVKVKHFETIKGHGATAFENSFYD